MTTIARKFYLIMTMTGFSRKKHLCVFVCHGVAVIAGEHDTDKQPDNPPFILVNIHHRLLKVIAG
jgi:hypothetical protein